jgi:beta-lactamase class A
VGEERRPGRRQCGAAAPALDEHRAQPAFEPFEALRQWRLADPDGIRRVPEMPFVGDCHEEFEQTHQIYTLWTSNHMLIVLDLQRVDLGHARACDGVVAVMTTPQLSRRAALQAGVLALTAVAAGCATRVAFADTVSDFAAVERRLNGRLGVYALDTGSGASVGYRADERFLLCSTGKALTVAAVLQRSEGDPALLDRVITYSQADVLVYAPVTSLHVADGMTVAALCEAAINVSDNTAANLLVGLLGGPPAVTAFARSLGDNVTRVDRIEPDLNVTSPGDFRDTSTSAQMATNLHTLVLGDALAPGPRDQLAGLLKANTTGDKSIRAGVPRDWVVGDKTGSGAQGESNDIAVVWPPNRAPLVIAVYTSPSDPHIAKDQSYAVIAQAAKIAVEALLPAVP